MVTKRICDENQESLGYGHNAGREEYHNHIGWSMLCTGLLWEIIQYNKSYEEREQMCLRREYQCFYCKETGHIAINCWLKSTVSNASMCEDKTSKEESMKKRTSAFIVGDIEKKQQISEYMWLGDFSTSCHVMNSLRGIAWCTRSDREHQVQ